MHGLRRAAAAHEVLDHDGREVVGAGRHPGALGSISITTACIPVLHPRKAVWAAALGNAAPPLRRTDGLACGRLIRRHAIAQGWGTLSLVTMDNWPDEGCAAITAASTVAIVGLEVLDTVAVSARSTAETDAGLIAVAGEITETLIARQARATGRAVGSLATSALGRARALARARATARVGILRCARGSVRARGLSHRGRDGSAGSGCFGGSYAQPREARQSREALTSAALASLHSRRASTLWLGLTGERRGSAYRHAEDEAPGQPGSHGPAR